MFCKDSVIFSTIFDHLVVKFFHESPSIWLDKHEKIYDTYRTQTWQGWSTQVSAFCCAAGIVDLYALGFSAVYAVNSTGFHRDLTE